jgi:hypothetical protein
MKKKYTFIRLGSFCRLGNEHFHVKEQMRNFEASFWETPRPNRKLRRIFLTGINNLNDQFEEDDKELSDEEEAEEEYCQVRQQAASQPETCISSPTKRRVLLIPASCPPTIRRPQIK